MTISELAAYFQTRYIDRHLKPTTARGYRVNISKYIVPLLGALPVEKLNYRIIDDAVDRMFTAGLSGRSVVYVLATLSKIYSFGIKQEFCAYNPVISYDYPRLKRYDYTVLSAEEVDKLLSATEKSTYFPAFLLACHYGLRRGECFGVTVGDISGDVLKISRSVNVVSKEVQITTPKSGKFRFIKLLPEDVTKLKEYDQKRPPSPSKLLIRSVTGKTVSPNMANKELKKYVELLKLPKIRFHDLRHTYATIMMENGINPKIVSEVLGHSSVDITLDIYSHCNTKMQDVCLDVWKGKNG